MSFFVGESDGWLLRLVCVTGKGRHQIHHKICNATVSGVFDLRNVFELIVDRFNQRSLPEHQFVPQRYQPWLHVLTNGGDQLQALVPQLRKQGLGDVSLVAEKFSGNSSGVLSKLIFRVGRGIVTRYVSEDEAAIHGIPRLRFGLLFLPPTLILSCDKALASVIGQHGLH